MVLLFLLTFLGACYTYWKFRASSNKKLFFSSPFFYSMAGSFLILNVSVAIVYTQAPYQVHNGLATILSDSMKSRVDTSFHALHDQSDLSLHYKLIKKITREHPEYITTIQKHYRSLSQDNDSRITSLGYFGTGCLSIESKEYDVALANFLKIPNQSLPYVHYCIAQCYRNTDKKLGAEKHYQAELSIENGNLIGALEGLVMLYKSDNNYAALKKLFDQFPQFTLTDQHLARLMLLHEQDYVDYLAQILSSITSRTKVWGLAAAVLISFVWIFYMLQLSIFRKSNVRNLALMFAAGCCSVLLIFVFNDLVDLHVQWHLDGSFFNDILFTTLIIGIPEEITKIIPFLFLIGFSKPFKEPLEYIVYASASALGFAFIENLLYFQETSSGVVHGRAYLSVIGHMVYSSVAAYAFVLNRFKKKGNLFFLFSFTLLTGSFFHGVYDFLIFQNGLILFFIFFVFIVQVWIIIINNCLNNSARFSYKNVRHAERIRVYITLALTSIFAAEYLLSGFSDGRAQSTQQFYSNISFAGVLIIFFTSNLSSFNFIKGYWRDIYFSSKEKRGYGTLAPRTLLTSWYFVNAIRSHNYVGLSVVLYNDLYNRKLVEVMSEGYECKVVDRIILYDRKDPDPHWFLLELVSPMVFESFAIRYALVKLRYQEESLTEDEYVQVFFKIVQDVGLLKDNAPQKGDFPFYGWARVRCVFTDQ